MFFFFVFGRLKVFRGDEIWEIDVKLMLMQRCVECHAPFDVGAPYCNAHNRMLYGVVVGKSSIPNAGNGLFAERDFKKREPVCPWQGEIQPLDTVLTADEEEYALSTKTHIVNPFKNKNLASIANTSASKDGTKSVRAGCNVEIARGHDGEPWLITTKKIPKGAEILCFYGNEYRMRPQPTVSP
jgi:hypothetical protein